MIISNIRSRIIVCSIATALAACSGSQPPIGAPGAMPQTSPKAMPGLRDWQHAKSRYHITYDFQGMPDGANPYTTLTVVNGMFYGTAGGGGTNNKGAVFEISASGKERVLYSFQGAPDGDNPQAGLVYANGKLFGTTLGGGTKGDGTVFEVTTSGKERVLHSFKNVPDGYYAITPLIAVNGALYGTTLLGGSSTCKPYSSGYAGCGTVFKVATSGKEQVLYRFEGGRADGVQPWAPLLAVDNDFYGTTEGGGEYGDGTVYAVSGSGKERVIYNFKGPPDGANPLAGVTAVNGVLYGTTYYGGSYGNSGGEGTVFRVDKTGGDERILYNFGGSIGAMPNASVLAIKGKLYGTTVPGFLGGTAFEMGMEGNAARLLHQFTGPPDGGEPNGLTYFGGALYGTTILGGKYGGSRGNGTAFELSLPSR